MVSRTGTLYGRKRPWGTGLEDLLFGHAISLYPMIKVWTGLYHGKRMSSI